MVVRFKDLVNHKINSANNQESFDLKKRKLKEEGISIEQLMELRLSKKMLKQFE